MRARPAGWRPGCCRLMPAGRRRRAGARRHGEALLPGAPRVRRPRPPGAHAARGQRPARARRPGGACWESAQTSRVRPPRWAQGRGDGSAGVVATRLGSDGAYGPCVWLGRGGGPSRGVTWRVRATQPEIRAEQRSLAMGGHAGNAGGREPARCRNQEGAAGAEDRG